MADRKAQVIGGKKNAPSRASRVIGGQERIGGFPIREPFPSESDFFRQNPHVSGMATKDKAITLNPFITLSPKERQSVATNEAVRLFLKAKNKKLNFDITPEQSDFFASFESQGLPGERDPADIRATLIGRILSGDPSAGNITSDQRKAADEVGRAMGLSK